MVRSTNPKNLGKVTAGADDCCCLPRLYFQREVIENGGIGARRICKSQLPSFDCKGKLQGFDQPLLFVFVPGPCVDGWPPIYDAENGRLCRLGFCLVPSHGRRLTRTTGSESQCKQGLDKIMLDLTCLSL